MLHKMTEEEIVEHNEKIEKWWRCLSSSVKWELHAFMTKLGLG